MVTGRMLPCCDALTSDWATKRNVLAYACRMTSGGRRPALAAQIPQMREQLHYAEHALLEHVMVHAREDGLPTGLCDDASSHPPHVCDSNRGRFYCAGQLGKAGEHADAQQSR